VQAQPTLPPSPPIPKPLESTIKPKPQLFRHRRQGRFRLIERWSLRPGQPGRIFAAEERGIEARYGASSSISVNGRDFAGAPGRTVDDGRILAARRIADGSVVKLGFAGGVTSWKSIVESG
jgi:hypothetical protein